MLTVQNLRKMGYRVKVFHDRHFTGSGQTFDFAPRGGKTEIEVYDPSVQCCYVGIAECSKKDQYNRKLGVRIALGRVLKKMGINQ